MYFTTCTDKKFPFIVHESCKHTLIWAVLKNTITKYYMLLLGNFLLWNGTNTEPN